MVWIWRSLDRLVPPFWHFCLYRCANQASNQQLRVQDLSFYTNQARRNFNTFKLEHWKEAFLGFANSSCNDTIRSAHFSWKVISWLHVHWSALKVCLLYGSCALKLCFNSYKSDIVQLSGIFAINDLQKTPFSSPKNKVVAFFSVTYYYFQYTEKVLILYCLSKK